MKRLFITACITVSAYSVCLAQKTDTSAMKTDTLSAKSKVADGSSYDRAIVITEKTEGAGTSAEYGWIRKAYPGSKVTSQSLNYHNKKPYDILHIVTADNLPKELYFDISNFFGKL